MKPSATMKVTGGLFEAIAGLSLRRMSENGAKKFFIIDSQRAPMSWVALESEGGRLSGMVLNWKSSNPSKELGSTPDFRKR